MAEFSTHFDDADNPEARRECERLATLMTAFFDGETEAEEARLARQHLIECARCAWALESWQRTRYLLQSSPVPSVPVGLLVRILLACRLSALPRRKKTSLAVHSQPASFKSHDMAMLGAHRSEADFALELAPAPAPAPDALAEETVDAPLRALIPTVSVPPHLKDEILKRTVGQQRETNSASQTTVAPLALAKSASPRKLRWDFGLAAPRRASQFAAFAVPATLAWLLVVTPRLTSSVLVASLPPSPTATPQKAVPSAAPRPVKLAMAPAPALARDARPVAVSAQPHPVPVAASPAAPQMPATAGSSSATETTVEVAPSEAHATLASYERPTKPAASPVNRVSGATASQPVAAHPQPQIAAPRLTLTTMPMKWSRSNEAVAAGNLGSGSRNLHVAVLDLDGQVRQPQSNDGDDNSDTADDISDISDHRPVEARQAIDSYRAALLSDAPASDASTSASDTDDTGTDG